MKVKKLGVAIALLLLLLATVGFDVVGGIYRLMIVDGREARDDHHIEAALAQAAADRIDGERISSLNSRPHAGQTEADDDQQAESEHESTAGPKAKTTERLVVGGQTSPIQFIHSNVILGSKGEPTETQKATLLEATAAVMAALEPGVMIFDADTESDKRGNKILLYARSELDLTITVKRVYDRLRQGAVEFVRK